MLFGASAALYGSGAGSSDQEIASYYGATGESIRQIYGFAALTLACVSLAVYIAVVLSRLRLPSPWSTLASISASSSVVLLMAANALWAGTAFTVRLQPGYAVDARSHLLLEDTAFILLVTAMAVAVPWVLAVSAFASRRGVLPRWFGWLGAFAAGALLTAYWYIPLGVFLVWIAVGSLLLVRGGPGGLRGSASGTDALRCD